MFQYFCGYIHSFTTFLEKEKINKIIDISEDNFRIFNKTKIEFNITINIIDLYFFILKDEKKVENYINKALQIAEKNQESSEDINLLIILVNKLLIFLEKEQKPYVIDILNIIINQLKNSSFIKNEIMKDDYKHIYIYYKNTFEYISKKKLQKLDKIYDSIIC